MIARTLIVLGLVSVLIQLGACKNDEPTDPQGEDFDRKAMLTNIADNVIIPSYDRFEKALTDFEGAYEAFKQDSSAGNATTLRNGFSSLYLAWQECAPYEFGPAANNGLRLLMNTFPADTSRIHALVAMNEYDLTSAQNTAAKTLPALDFVLNTFSDEELQEAGVQQFLDENVALMRETTDAVVAEWQTSYRDEFINNTGSSVGSSLGMLVNELNRDFELIKNARVGIPLGKKTLGVAQPEKVEAYYGGTSVRLIIEHLGAIRVAFEGGSGSGIDDLLDALDARYQDQLLSDAIADGFTSCASSAAAINGRLDEAIVNEPSKVEDLHTKLQNLVVLLKTDMPSQLGVQITYQDNDGD